MNFNSHSREEEDKNFSIVEYMGDNSGYRCGYCKSTDSNYSNGMWAHKMCVADYQALINRGWRRSGKYCYKPTMDKTCCPHYTIRCDCLNFKISKSQKKVLKRMNNFLSYGRSKTKELQDVNLEVEESSGAELMIPEHRVHADLSSICVNKIDTLPEKEEIQSTSDKEVSENTCQQSLCNKSKYTHSVSGPDPNRMSCKKAKLIRQERKAAKRGFTKVASTGGKNLPKTLEDLLNASLPENPAHRLEVKLLRSNPPSLEFMDSFDSTHSVYQKYQMSVHSDPKDKCTVSKFRRFLVNSPLQLRLVSVKSFADFSNSREASYRLFRQYQMTIHNESEDECTLSSYVNFLVDSPLMPWKPCRGPLVGYGSFHQQYWLDDELIAVGVIDILPDCVSSVYLYYDPKYSFLSLGTYSSLREIALTKELHKVTPRLKWYYMGFYIHSCPKMRYKGKYSSSYLLCPEEYTWEPIEKCLPKLDINKYSKLNEDESSAEEQIDITKLPCLHDGALIRYGTYQQKHRGSRFEDNEVREYASLIGSQVAYSMLLYRG